MFSKLLIVYVAFLWICKSQRHLVYGTATALIHCNDSTKRTRAPTAAGGTHSTFTLWHHPLPPPRCDAVRTLLRIQRGIPHAPVRSPAASVPTARCQRLTLSHQHFAGLPGSIGLLPGHGPIPTRTDCSAGWLSLSTAKSDLSIFTLSSCVFV